MAPAIWRSKCVGRTRPIATLVIVKANIEVDATHFPGSSLIGTIGKRNGETVCLISQERDMTGMVLAKIKEIMRGVSINTTGELSKNSFTNSRALMVVSDTWIGPLNPPTIYDVPLGWDNVRTEIVPPAQK
jgi:hypothetical protein